MNDNAPAQPIEVVAPSLEQAIEDGLTQLGLTRNDVIIEIVEEGSRGVLGMGARNAVVKLTPLRIPNPVRPPAPQVEKPIPAAPAELPHEEPAAAIKHEPKPQPAVRVKTTQQSPEREPLSDAEQEEQIRVAKDTLHELLGLMDIDADIHTHQAEEDERDSETPWVFDIHGQDLGILIGRRGETLAAIQYITRLIVSRELQRRANVIIDVEGYKSRREDALRKLAHRMASQVKKMGRSVTLEPMPPNERRIVHLALRDDREVTTESVGTGDQRKVTIYPAGQ